MYYLRTLAPAVWVCFVVSAFSGCSYNSQRISPDVTRCAVDVAPASIVGDGVDSAVATVTVATKAGLPAGFPVRVLVGNSNDGVLQVRGATDGNGTVVAYLTSRQTGSWAISADVRFGQDVLHVSAPAPLVVNAATVPPRFGVLANPVSPVAGSAFALTVTALQSDGQPAPGYLGAITFSSSDPNAVLPSVYAFTANDLGVHAFSAQLTKAGLDTVSVVDTRNSADAGATSVLVQAGNAVTFQIVPNPPSATAGTTGTLTVIPVDRFGNVDTGYTGVVTFSVGGGSQTGVLTFTSGQGSAQAPVTWTSSGPQTITVTDTSSGVSGSTSVDVAASSPYALSISMNSSAPLNNRTDFTVSALDIDGNVSPGYMGAVTFTSTDRSAFLPAVYTFLPSDNGTKTFVGGAVFHQVGTFSLTAQDVNSPADPSPGVFDIIVVQPIAPYLQLQFANSQAQVGVPQTLTVTARGTQNAVLPSYVGTVTFSSDDRTAILPPNYSFTAGDAGTKTFAVTMNTMGSYYVAATDVRNVSMMGVSPPVAVGIGPVARLAVSSTPNTVVAGQPVTLSITAVDAGGDVVTSFGDALSFSSDDPNAVLPGAYAYTASDAGTHTFTFAFTTTPGPHQLTAVDQQNSAARVQISGVTVQAGPVTSFALSGAANTTAGTAAGTNLRATALDVYNNPVTIYQGTVQFRSTDPMAALPAVYTYGSGDNGSHVFSPPVFFTAGAQTVTIEDVGNTTIRGRQSGILVQPAAAARLFVSGLTSGLAAGTVQSITVVALDAYSNIATGYTDSIHFASDDNQAHLQSDALFSATDQGTKTFQNAVTLKTAGVHYVSASDTALPTITGNQNGIEVTNATIGKFSVSGFPSPVTAGTPEALRVAALDVYGNPVTNYVGIITFTSTDGRASLPSTYSFLPTNDGVYTGDVTLFTAGPAQSISVADLANSAYTGSQLGIAVAAGDANSLKLTGLPTTVTSSQSVQVTVTAFDAYANVATSYTGPVTFTCTDSAASLPALTPLTNGNQVVTVALRTSGWQSVHVFDPTNVALTDQQDTNVIAGGAVSFNVSLSANVMIAGSATSVIVVARDANNNQATGYMGTVTFTSSDGNALLPQAYAFGSGDQGAHTFLSEVTLKTAGSPNVIVTDPNAGLMGYASASVSPGPLATFYVQGAASGVAGVSGGMVTVTATDAFGNPVSSYTGTVMFSSSDSQATLPANYPFGSPDSGSHAFPGIVLKTAGTQSITVTDSSNTTLSGTQQNIVVTAASATGLQVSGIADGAAPDTTIAIVRAVDPYGNTDPNFSDSVHFTSSDININVKLPLDHSFDTVDGGIHTFAGVVLVTEGSQWVNANDVRTATIAGRQNNIQVSNGNVVGLQVSGYPTPATAGVSNGFTVQAVDAYGNDVANYLGTITFSSSDPNAVLPTAYTFAARDQGRQSFSATFETANKTLQSLTATDTHSITGSQNLIQVNPANANRFVLSGLPGNANAGASLSVLVTAQDAFGNTASGYTGTVTFTSTDPQASLPVSYAFGFADSGKHSFASDVSLYTAGNQNITVADTVMPSITGTQSGIVVSASTATHIAFTTNPAANVPVCQAIPPSIQVSVLDAWGNKVAAPSRSITITLNANATALSGVQTQTTSVGTATFDGLTINQNGNTYQFGASTSGLLNASSSVFNVVAVSPNVTIATPTGTSGNIMVPYTVTDVCGAPAMVQVDYSTYGSQFARATQGAGNANGVYNVPTSSSGQSLLYDWDSSHDISYLNATTAAIRITVTTKNGWAQATTPFLTVNNGVQFNETTQPGSGFCVAVADANHDAKLDLFTCSATHVFVLSGNGNFGFTQTALPAAAPYAIATGDIDHNGHDDFVMADANGIEVYTSGANGVSWHLATTLSPQSQRALLLVDINLDGNLDVISGVNNIVSYALGTSTSPYFGAMNTLTVGSNLSTGAAIDFNKDGNSEVAFADQGGNVVILSASISGTLTLWTTVPNVGTAMGIDVADFNRDGNQDFVVATSSNGVSIGLGTGGTTFTVTQVIAAAATRVKAGDFDGDGIADLAVLISSSGLEIGVGKGDGTFAFAPAPSLPGPGEDLVVGGFNHDNKLDIVVSTTSGAAVFENTRVSRTWDSGGARSFYIDTGLVATAIGDFNRDGKPDVAVSSNTNNRIDIWTGDGTGVLQYATSLAISQPELPTAADINGDNFMDLLVPSNNGNTVVVFLNVNGVLQNGNSYPTGGAQPRQVATTDLDNDGRLDAVVANVNTAQISVLLGKGDGTLGTATLYPVPTGTTAVGAGYFNADGLPDVVAASQNSSALFVLFNTGSVPLLGSAQSEITEGAPATVAVGYFNQDTYSDIATAVFSANTIDVFLNTGDSNFTRSSVPSPGGPRAVVAAKVDGDSFTDLVGVLQNTNFATVFSGSPNGTFSTAGSFPTDVTPIALAVDDLTGDGLPDMVVTNSPSLTPQNSISVLRGETGRFVDCALNANSPVPLFDVALADFNLDAYPDAGFISSITSNNNDFLYIYLGDRAGDLDGPIAASNIGTMPQAVRAADINQDGWPDLVVSPDTNVGQVLAFINQKSGSLFSTSTSVSVGPNGSSVYGFVLNDINNDSKPDIVGALNGTSSLGFALGKGNGTFNASVTVACTGQPNPSDLDVGDINNDGWPDTVVAYRGDNFIGVLTGPAGSGIPTTCGSRVTVSAPQNAFLVDLNWDGWLDIVVASETSTAQVSVYLNNNGTFPSAPSSTYDVVGFYTPTANSFVHPADINVDGNIDVIVGNWAITNDIAVLLGDGSGAFSSPIYLVTFRDIVHPRAASLTRNGMNDIVAPSYRTNGHAIGVVLSR